MVSRGFSVDLRVQQAVRQCDSATVPNNTRLHISHLNAEYLRVNFTLINIYIYNISMPISFDLESLRKEHNCVNYFETGLWDPRTEVSSTMALRCDFEKVYCIEIRKDWVDLGNEVFKEYITKGKYNLYILKTGFYMF